MKTKIKIFHLEDDNEWIDIVKSALDGYEVYSARTLQEAITLYGAQKFDAAILDISLMPGDSKDQQGERFLNALKGLDVLPGKRIIILSAYLMGLSNQDRVRKYFRFYDVKDAIPKQKFDSKEFREVMDEIVESPIASDAK